MACIEPATPPRFISARADRMGTLDGVIEGREGFIGGFLFFCLFFSDLL